MAWHFLGVSENFLTFGALYLESTAGAALSRDSSTALRPLKTGRAGLSCRFLRSLHHQVLAPWPSGLEGVVSFGPLEARTPLYCSSCLGVRAPCFSSLISLRSLLLRVVEQVFRLGLAGAW